MKKIILFIMLGVLIFMLFSCLDESVETPTPTRPDLDLPIPIVPDHGINDPGEPGKWLYDPDPNDDVYIYGGAFGNLSFVIVIEDFKATITLQQTDKVSRAQLNAIGLAESDVTCTTVYRLTELNCPILDLGYGTITLYADEFQITSSMYISTSSDIGVSDYVNNKIAFLKDIAKDKHINKAEMDKQISYLNGETQTVSGTNLEVIVSLDGSNGTCMISSTECIIDNVQHTTTNGYAGVRLALTRIATDADGVIKQINYDKSGNIKSVLNSYIHEDGEKSSTEIEYGSNNVLDRYALYLDDRFARCEVRFYDNGSVSEMTYNASRWVVENKVSYHDNGNISYEYKIVDDRGYETYYNRYGLKYSESIHLINEKNLESLGVLSCIEWYDNGTKMFEELSAEGKRGNLYLQTMREWYEDGTLAYEYSAEENGDINYERLYDENGVLLSEAVRKSGQNTETGYYPNGKIYYIKTSSTDYPYPTILYYSETGELMYTRYYKRNATYYDEYPEIDGFVLRKEYDTKDLLVGERIISEGKDIKYTQYHYYYDHMPEFVSSKDVIYYIENKVESYAYSTDGFLESCQIQKRDEDHQIIETTYTQYREDGGVWYVHFADYIKRLLDEKTYFPSGKLSLHCISNIDTGKVLSWVEYNEDGSVKGESN